MIEMIHIVILDGFVDFVGFSLFVLVAYNFRLKFCYILLLSNEIMTLITSGKGHINIKEIHRQLGALLQ